MMTIRIYQINPERDTSRLMFMDADFLAHKVGEVRPDSSAYDLVFEGKVDCGTMEGVFQKFNTDLPPEYLGRLLSVSDVIEVVEGDDVKPGFYFCDSIGFKQVPFDPNSVRKLTDSKIISVVIAEPGKRARAAYIDSSLEGMQRIVGGYIQAIYPFEEEVCIVCNEEGKMDGLPLNRALRDKSGEIFDIIAGTFFICGCGGENFSGLTDEQIKRYTQMYEYPERFINLGGKIHAVRIHDREAGEIER